MMSRGKGGTPRQERKRKTGGKENQPPALAGVDPGLLRELRQSSASKTFAHHFRASATRVTSLGPPRAAVLTLRRLELPRPGLAAVKHAQQQMNQQPRRPGPVFMPSPRSSKTAQIIDRLLSAGWSMAQIRAKFPELFTGASLG